MTDGNFWDRSVESFSDAIITTVRETTPGVWYAVVDVRGTRFPHHFHADFSTGAATPEDAVARCADKVRADLRGEGRWAPRFRDIDLFYLKQWWEQKEQGMEIQ